ncbi:MAG: ankyrin repeat domain-containing protein [Woeseiaceae bacterium]
MIKTSILITLLWTASTALGAENPIAPQPNEQRDKALIQSAFDGELANVQGLVKKGASLEATGPKNRTAMIWAAANGHTPVVEYLHDAGADINAKDSGGHTALMFAVKGSHVETVQYLLENGADIDARSVKRGFTALITAAAIGNGSVVRLLLKHGADKDIAERDGNTAHDRATQYGHPDIAALLEDESTPSNSS